jgi:hypothetical protein
MIPRIDIESIRLPAATVRDDGTEPKIIDATCEYAFFVTRARLMPILDEVVTSMYNLRKDSSVPKDSVRDLALEKVMELDLKLNDWQDSVPEHLKAPVGGLDDPNSEFTLQANTLRQR